MEKSILNKKDFEHKINSYAYNSNFGKYGRIYSHTNENLKEYVTDLSDKKVLTVSASGDQLLNCIGAGSIEIDTFDINIYSPLYQSLKIHAIKHLSLVESLEYISTLRYDLYLRFCDYLPNDVKNFFDFLYSNYSIPDIRNILFYKNYSNIQKVNNYYDINKLKEIRDKLKILKHNHYSTNLYNVSDFLDKKYDAILLSNISHYCNPKFFLNYITYLSDYYLNDDGKIYLGYIYDSKGIDDSLKALRSISPNYEMCYDFPDVIDNLDIININGSNARNTTDTVVVLTK